jgi:quercetin dioxygenase-like cupin family protein
MSDFTKINLMDDVSDSMAEHAPGEIEGRFTRTPIGTADFGVSRFTYSPNVRSPSGHHHREQEEAYLVIAGSGRVLLDDEAHELRQWDVVRVGPSVVRAFEAGADGLDLVAVGGPKPEGGDGVLAESSWPAG